MTRGLMAAAAFAFGCNSPPPSTPTPSPAVAAVAPARAPVTAPPEASKALPPTAALPPCVRDARALGLNGATPEQLEARFGAPATRETFKAIERQGEFYAGIENLYPSTDPKNHDVPLQEWTWRSGDCTLTVWFHHPDATWRAIDDVYWHKQIDF